MNDSELLPHWAGVALIARCARLVLPSFDKAWPEAPMGRRNEVISAIRAAEESAANGVLSADHREADMRATIVCGALRQYVLARQGESHGMAYDESEGYPADIKQAQLAAGAAAVAAKATEAARTNPNQSSQIAIEGLNWAALVADEDSDLMEELRHEFRAIRVAAEKGKWTHETPVVWGPHGWQKLA